MSETEVETDTGLKAKVTYCDDAFEAADMEKGKSIGIGASGFVHLAVDKKNKDEKKAVKIFSQEADCVDFLREVAILQNVDHKHIISNIQAFVTPDYKAISMPFYPRGTVRQNLDDLTMEWAMTYFVQVTSAVYYLHKRQIVHRDIKPDNILLTEDNRAILTDFGFSYMLNTPAVGVACSTGYRPPEMKTNILKSYNYYKGDSYALGVTLWNMSWKTHNVYEGQCLHCMSTPVKDLSIYFFLVYHLCHHKVEERWSVEDIIDNKKEEPMLYDLLESWDWHLTFFKDIPP